MGCDVWSGIPWASDELTSIPSSPGGPSGPGWPDSPFWPCKVNYRGQIEFIMCRNSLQSQKVILRTLKSRSKVMSIFQQKKFSEEHLDESRVQFLLECTYKRSRRPRRPFFTLEKKEMREVWRKIHLLYNLHSLEAQIYRASGCRENIIVGLVMRWIVVIKMSYWSYQI